MYIPLYAMYYNYILYTLYSVLYALYSIQYTVYYILHKGTLFWELRDEHSESRVLGWLVKGFQGRV